MQKADPLIRTKLHLPVIRPGLVARPRLQEQIAQGLCGPLTLITAPAGFGKTTLLAASLAGRKAPAAWLSLDKNDNQPGRFLTYLIAALQAANPAIGSEAEQLIGGAQQARYEAVLTSLINDLDSAGKDMVLVLDDYHQISNLEAHEALTFLLDHQPGSLHLVILTRSDPPLPLARRRARGQMVELRTADLRFTEQEAALFMNDVMDLHLDAVAVAALEERTEGWIAGLQMAALSMKDRKDVAGFIKGFSGTNRYILDFLLEEVLSRQPAEIQHFLLCTSILGRMDAALCDALMGAALLDSAHVGETPFTGSSADILTALERGNVFLLALDDDAPGGSGATWFRYHHLFADLLRARLQQTQPDLIPHLHQCASAWFEQNGFIPEAIQHLVSAQEIGRAADLMERYGPVYWLENDPSIIQLAESLPTEMLLDRPKLGLYLAWLCICQARIDKALLLLRELAQHIPQAQSDTGLLWIHTVVQCAQAFLSPPADQQGAVALPLETALDEIPEGEPILRDAGDILYGMAIARRGDLDAAVRISLRCIQMPSRRAWPGATGAVPSLVPFLARIYLFQGHLQAAIDVCREYLGPIKEKGTRFINSPGSMEISFGEALYERNDLDEAEKLIRDGLRANEPWVNIMTDGFGIIGLTRVLQAKGDISGAAHVLQDFLARTDSAVRPREFEEAVRTLGARLQLDAGNLKGASFWAEQTQKSEDYQRHPERYRLTLAHIFLAQGDLTGVEAILAPEPSPVPTANQIARQIETHLLLAAAAASQQRTLQAFDHLGTGLALAEPEGYLRVFLNMGEPIRDLLAAYLRSAAPGHRQYAQKILEAFTPSKAAGSAAQQADGLAEPLTNRELEVLALMALGKTNLEIARQLVVSTGTIKAHAASIYRKLDAANRTEAVARARELGVIT